MATKQTNKITVKDIIKRKNQILKKRQSKKTFYVGSLEGDIVCNVPDTEIVMDALDMEGRNGDLYLIYNCMVEPNLKSPELQEAFELDTPMHIVEQILTPGEVSSLSIELLKCAGYHDSVKLVEEVKN